jgi:prefoldin subunit 5
MSSAAAAGKKNDAEQDEEQQDVPNMSIQSIIEGDNERGIPHAKFIDDVDMFSATFDPPASAELLIGAYSDLIAKYRNFETQLSQKGTKRTCAYDSDSSVRNLELIFKKIVGAEERLSGKVPELEKSLNLVKSLAKKKDLGVTSGVVRYSLADNLYANADVDFTIGTVNLWLGANVMLEFTYDEAMEFLSGNELKAKRELAEFKQDIGFVRDQIVTCEVTMSRIFNWDVRKKRAAAPLRAT